MPPVHNRPGVRVPSPPAPSVITPPPVNIPAVSGPAFNPRTGMGADAYDARPAPVTVPPARGGAVTDAELDILTRTMKAKGENVVDVMPGPTRTTATSVTYDFGPNGRVMKPGDLVMLGVPQEWRNRLVGNVTLVHRQDPATDAGLDAAGGRDSKPGLTAVNIHSADDGTWRKWNSPWGSNGRWGAKFAEQRAEHDPEFENMFEWNIQGHENADRDGSPLKHVLRPNGIRVASVGEDDVVVHRLIIDFIGERPGKTMEHVFTPGTAFGDWDTGEGRTFGGGQKFGGKYPGALQVGTPTGGPGAATLPAGWRVNQGMLEVPLEPGKVITGVDLAAGDTRPDGLRNKDGGVGTSGKSRFSMGVQNAQGQVEWFVDRIGVPPQGVLSGAPANPRYVTQPGDKLVFRTEVDTVHVMALRVGLKDPPA